MQITKEMKVALKDFLFESLKNPQSKVTPILQKMLKQKTRDAAEIKSAIEALKAIQKNIKNEKEESEDLVHALLANCAQRGIGFSDAEKAQAYGFCTKANEQYPLAQYVMARCLRFKTGCEQSVDGSIFYYKAAAKKNIVSAQLELAFIFEKGSKAVPKDDTKAAKLREIAAKQSAGMAATFKEANEKAKATAAASKKQTEERAKGEVSHLAQLSEMVQQQVRKSVKSAKSPNAAKVEAGMKDFDTKLKADVKDKKDAPIPVEALFKLFDEEGQFSEKNGDKIRSDILASKSSDFQKRHKTYQLTADERKGLIEDFKAVKIAFTVVEVRKNFGDEGVAFYKKVSTDLELQMKETFESLDKDTTVKGEDDISKIIQKKFYDYLMIIYPTKSTEILQLIAEIDKAEKARMEARKAKFEMEAKQKAEQKGKPPISLEDLCKLNLQLLETMNDKILRKKFFWEEVGVRSDDFQARARSKPQKLSKLELKILRDLSKQKMWNLFLDSVKQKFGPVGLEFFVKGYQETEARLKDPAIKGNKDKERSMYIEYLSQIYTDRKKDIPALVEQAEKEEAEFEAKLKAEKEAAAKALAEKKKLAKEKREWKLKTAEAAKKAAETNKALVETEAAMSAKARAYKLEQEKAAQAKKLEELNATLADESLKKTELLKKVEAAKKEEASAAAAAGKDPNAKPKPKGIFSLGGKSSKTATYGPLVPNQLGSLSKKQLLEALKGTITIDSKKLYARWEIVGTAAQLKESINRNELVSVGGETKKSSKQSTASASSSYSSVQVVNGQVTYQASGGGNSTTPTLAESEEQRFSFFNLATGNSCSLYVNATPFSAATQIFQVFENDAALRNHERASVTAAYAMM